ncbi:Bifunctional DNA primase/polymerase, N-terminal [Pseudomonas fluorescens]|uniref:Bifunctional DNA primase/polymerase, N-terminal n=1 Tax=Pseudomonas fluorescens TaxID=294 RepID=A0A379IHR2_PSEFL|nr:Bifunctional DNA primase/polymerase, N-terminal [Pseudomonas fluorescens]
MTSLVDVSPQHNAWAHIENEFERAAHERLDFGDWPIPVDASEKVTLVKWKPWIASLCHGKISRYWRTNPTAALGIIVDERTIVLDADSPESLARLRELAEKYRAPCNWIQKTRKGQHFRYQTMASSVASGDVLNRSDSRRLSQRQKPLRSQ